MDTKTIKVIIRVLPNNEDVVVELPLNATAKDVIESLIAQNIAQRNDNAGNPITYNLTPKGKNIVIEENETLDKAQVQEGDLVLMTPVFVAGKKGQSNQQKLLVENHKHLSDGDQISKV